MKNSFINKHIGTVLILAMIACGAVFRIRVYQDALSIGTTDTESYIQSAHLPLLSLDILKANRPFTMSLMYKIMEPSTGYQLTLIAKPWLGTLDEREFQSGLNRISVAQSLMSIIGWSAVALAVSRRLNNLIIRVLAVLLILAFSYSPQLAEWDGVLMSESLSFSLFALLLALTIEAGFRIAYEKPLSRLSYLVMVVWFIVFSLWVFSRDVNAFLALLTIVMFAITLVIPGFRNKIDYRPVMVVLVLLLGVFFIENASFRASERWVNSFLNLVIKNVMPYPEHVDYFKAQGMPVTEDMFKLQGSDGNELGFYKLEGFMPWVYQSGYSTYALFLVTHPQWTFTRFFDRLDFMFWGNRQVYFRGRPEFTPLWMLPIGDKLHPTNSWIILVDLSFTIIILLAAYKRRARNGIAWGWISVWLFIGEILLLFLSFHGDTLGVERHALVAVVPLRLSIWLLLVVALDLVFMRSKGLVAAS